MKICILSDSHDHIPLLDAAVESAMAEGAEAVLHCGDVVAPSTLHCLDKYDLPIHVIHGNNTGDLYTLGQLASRDENNIHYHGMDAGVQLGGRNIFLVHYPHYARAMAATGDWDLVCCGHSHKLKVEKLENIKGSFTYLVNPGTIGGVGRSPATYIVADLDSMSFESREISKQIERDAGYY
ncbi:MAG: YfcE family phosphodiesterase [Candidatus Thiodiazotropha sp. (ex Ctena orbiculata)]|uniref:Phosphoesterase n=1 Tax=Candidatus Thiodiazotropha taylori TaxID=2792791 RepID=A0A944QVM2_9GAMM|nr:YfcE family phosphodiesterase [Candidatus Thiodiazotropha taylori]PUB89854.1 MAG: YfcE family phosphodiesterase [gamma proteobacterium symbiont of Ctena orbiculata]MBT2989551.1 YfcE family phosphodiesterase [Candidatus Thiodiazotropha taylori]MBT2997131.1 YfcE family phosphodiesterase [Candidatus Thiodiazotropha taylori]MBT3001284.1 YfcE family phosphodiesterase [Candidatus Thiodiazotropha taylori]